MPVTPGDAVDPPPVEPRPAATVVIVREARDGPEVLLGRRPPTMAFAPDVHVFPGGRVDDADADPALIARSVMTPEAAAEAMGGDISPTAAIAASIAAIRESFEEAGVLLAAVGTASPGPGLGAARAALVGGEIGFAALTAQLDLTLRTDWLTPLSRWVTPASYPRRFDARIFAAAMPSDAVASLEGDEVIEQVWMRPVDALDAMTAGEMSFWLPTSTTLQQLLGVTRFEEIAARLAPGRLGEIVVDEPVRGITRIVMPAGGGVAGQPVNAYLVGDRSFVIVDPGDPTGPGLDRAVELATSRGGTIAAILLTHVDPDHAAGAEALAERLEIPVFVGPGGGRHLPYEVQELADGDPVEAGDIRLGVVATPGPRPDHLAFRVGDHAAILTGDLDGRRGARMIPTPSDEFAWAASLTRLDELAPSGVRLGGHPPPD